jgi:hypothetical protein
MILAHLYCTNIRRHVAVNCSSCSTCEVKGNTFMQLHSYPYLLLKILSVRILLQYNYLADHFPFILPSHIWWSPFSHQYFVFHEIANMNLLCLLYWECISKTSNRLLAHFYCTNIRRRVAENCSTCSTCEVKGNRSNTFMQLHSDPYLLLKILSVRILLTGEINEKYNWIPDLTELF